MASVRGAVMSTMQGEVCEAFRVIVVPEGKALHAAAALASAFAKSDDHASHAKRDTAIDEPIAEIAVLDVKLVKPERDLGLLE